MSSIASTSCERSTRRSIRSDAKRSRGSRPTARRTFSNAAVGGRWLLLKRPENLSEKQTARLDELLKLNLASIKGYLLRENFQRFWDYQRPDFAGKFLDNWVTRALRTDLEPMKKVARMLRNHKPLVLNWFKAKGRLSNGAVEGLNLKAKLTISLHPPYKNSLFHFRP